MSELDFQTKNSEMAAVLSKLNGDFWSGESILLVGESGTGKTLLIRGLEKQKQNRPFLVLENIQALSIPRRKEISQRAKTGEFQVIASATQMCPELEDSFSVHQILPLRKRPEDIEHLANFFLMVQAHLRISAVTSLSTKALEKLKKYHWPKNVLELETAIDRAMTICSFNTITEEDIYFEVSETAGFLGLSLAEMERKLILQTLEITEQNRTRAAEILGISIRTFRNKLTEYRGGTEHESTLR